MNFFGKNSMIKLMELIKSTFSNVLRRKGDSEFSPSGVLNDADLFKGHQMSEFVMKGTDPIEPILPILPKDADRLEGHDAGYFASKNELDAEVSRAKAAEGAINDSLTNLIKYAEKSFTFSFDAGTIGTRATQLAANISEFGITNINNIISAYITSLGSAQQVVPNILISPATNGVYINCYRATAIAVTNMTLTVRIIYKTK